MICCHTRCGTLSGRQDGARLSSLVLMGFLRGGRVPFGVVTRASTISKSMPGSMKENMITRVLRRLRLVKGVKAGTLLLLLLTSLSGCVPTRPNDLPLYMSPGADGVTFRWCGERIENVKRVEVTYATLTPQREDHLAGEWVGNFSLSHGVELSPKFPPEGAEYEENRAIPDDVDPMLVFAYISLATSSRSMPTVIYEIHDPLLELSGEWIAPAGARGASKCPAGA
jgi:hypothetical protein